MKTNSNPIPKQYDSPVADLLAIGDVRNQHGWIDYPAVYGLTLDHVPNLIRMMQDERLYWAGSESDEVWAPIHAWRTLGQLRAESAIDAILEMFPTIDSNDSDWEQGELPRVLGMIGSAAIPAVQTYLNNPVNGHWSRIAVADALGKIGAFHPDTRDECVAILTTQLEQYQQESESFNAFIIADLADLRAVESASIIEAAFKAEKVDLSIQGDWEEVQVYMGLLEQRITPKPEYGWVAEDQIPQVKKMRELFKRLEIEKQEVFQKKVGRNAPCPCGSGKKYKKCHGNPRNKH